MPLRVRVAALAVATVVALLALVSANPQPGTYVRPSKLHARRFARSLFAVCRALDTLTPACACVRVCAQ